MNKTFKIELDDQEVQTLTYRRIQNNAHKQTTRKDDEYLVRQINNTIDKITKQIKEQLDMQRDD